MTERTEKRVLLGPIRKQKSLHFMILPALLLVVVFNYLPIAGLVMAFKDFSPRLGIFGGDWVGLKNFNRLFLSGDFLRLMRNTFAMSSLTLGVGFPLPIIFAILLNELRYTKLKKFVQTSSYLPYFISWVVAANLIMMFLSRNGTLNSVLLELGIIDSPVVFFRKGLQFWFIIAFANLWKNMGWNTIIYLAAISGIDPQLYDAAHIDGANRFQRIIHITVPSIMFTIVFLLILSIASLINAGFEQQLLLGNSLIWDYADTIDTYTYRYGLGQGLYAYGAAVGFFKSVTSCVLLISANTLARKTTGIRIW